MLSSLWLERSCLAAFMRPINRQVNRKRRMVIFVPNKLCISFIRSYVRLNAVNTWEIKFIHGNNYQSLGKKTEIKECYKLLNLHENCNFSQLRESFIHFAKKYHPDGGMPTSDAKKFADVKNAYKIIRKNMREIQELGELAMVDEEEIEKKYYDIKHTAPQHRQYLSYEGIGYGNISQRQKQYQQYKVSKAVEAVHEHRIQNLAAKNEDGLIVKDKTEAKKHKIRNAIERLVEDLIQESMAKGDFENLPGKGKPLQHTTYSPYIDSTTQKLNEVLINNGFTPQWIILEKEIRNESALVREKLKLVRRKIGHSPLSEEKLAEWSSCISSCRDNVKTLNSKINTFNLLVPILNKQLMHFQLEKEAGKLLEYDCTQIDTKGNALDKEQMQQGDAPTQDGLLGLLSMLIR